MRAALIFNPRSGRGHRRPTEKLLTSVLDDLREGGIEGEPMPTEGTGHATVLARNAVADRFDRVVAWGGDGTINEVVSALVRTDVPLGVLPGGTVNVFARETGLGTELRAAVRHLVLGRIVRIPVGVANGRPFLSMAGAGLDAEVVYRLKGSLKDRLGALAFWLNGFRALAHYSMSPIRARCEEMEFVATSVIAGKIRRYGPRYFMTPEARLDEPKLHVIGFQGKGIKYLKYLIGVIGQFHLRFDDVANVKTDRITLTAEAEHEVCYQLDGEPAGHLPVTIEVIEDALSVVLP
jgi:YegS/Rv2252/BmrU family lipid kinase